MAQLMFLFLSFLEWDLLLIFLVWSAGIVLMLLKSKSPMNPKMMQWCHPAAQQQPLTWPIAKSMAATDTAPDLSVILPKMPLSTVKHISDIFRREEKQRNNQKAAASSSTHTRLLWKTWSGSNLESACISTEFCWKHTVLRKELPPGLRRSCFFGITNSQRSVWFVPCLCRGHAVVSYVTSQ